MQADTPGKRVYLIRLALGDGFKRPLSMADFAGLIAERGGVFYDSSMLSRMENGTRRVTLEDIDALAPLDPLQRGKAWLAWGEAVDATVPVTHTYTPEEREADAIQDVKDRAALAAERRRRRKAGGGR